MPELSPPDTGHSSDSVIIFAPDGIGEVTTDTDLTTMITEAVAGHPAGALRPGDIVVVTSKIISKQQGRRRPAEEMPTALAEESRRTVARRSQMIIVESRLGLVQPAAGIDRSNVETSELLLLPTDPDATAKALCAELSERAGGPVGVIISDTAGRVWRMGQTDHVIGAAGVTVLLPYAGRFDAYGNELKVTTMAVGDELASAADLVKAKLAQRPVAVIRGLGALLADDGQQAADLVRPSIEDLFRLGSRESVVAALLTAVGAADRFEAVVALDEPADITAAILTGLDLGPAERALVAATVLAACRP